ncbi:hypothetical protein [Rickettsia endosymbiont of Pantilius tunicatus]|uniref:hypothetical protein n=1 Tax=Rickettsia endosymbiont of Pantilius tunicatus TaxID=3066267 RepID=UPI00376F0704
MAKSWYVHWDNLMIFLGYPEEIRKIIYTTNAVFKSLYLAIDYMTKKWSMPMPNWNAAMAHFLIKFEDRI